MVRDDDWAYGVTTVSERISTTFPRTIASLRRSGFTNPRLFVDGVASGFGYSQLELEVTMRWPRLRTFGNWILGLWELYLRKPNADRFVIFQDDIEVSANLKAYLSRMNYLPYTYYNLCTYPDHYHSVPQESNQRKVGWYTPKQFGKGAQGLLFDRNAVCALLSSYHHIVVRPQNILKGHRNIDGGISGAMNKKGYAEMVHNPSLIGHMQGPSAMGSKPQPEINMFMGENFDCLRCLKDGHVQQDRPATVLDFKGIPIEPNRIEL